VVVVVMVVLLVVTVVAVVAVVVIVVVVVVDNTSGSAQLWLEYNFIDFKMDKCHSCSGDQPRKVRFSSGHWESWKL
jgi:hypothetical protein